MEKSEIYYRDWAKFPNDDETQQPIWKISDYPHLFRKLNWWEKRDISEMPKKVLSKIIEPHQVYFIEEWDMTRMIGWINKEKRECIDLLLYKPEIGYFPTD